MFLHTHTAWILATGEGLVLVGGFLVLIVVCLLVIAAARRPGASSSEKHKSVMSISDIPANVGDTLAQFIPVPLPEELSVHYRESGVPKEYLFRIDRGEEQFLVEVNLRGDPPFVRQIEMNHEERIGHRRRKAVQEIAFDKVPSAVREVAAREMQWANQAMESIHRVSCGKILGQDAYKIEGRTGDWEFEIGALASGEVLQVEFTNKTPIATRDRS